jgi:hypothetical protein
MVSRLIFHSMRTRAGRNLALRQHRADAPPDIAREPAAIDKKRRAQETDGLFAGGFAPSLRQEI